MNGTVTKGDDDSKSRTSFISPSSDPRLAMFCAEKFKKYEVVVAAGDELSEAEAVNENVEFEVFSSLAVLFDGPCVSLSI